MDTLKEMRMQLTADFSTMNTDSLILVLGGASQQLAATGSCGSTGSSSGCDATSVCNCCVKPPIKRPDTGGE